MKRWLPILALCLCAALLLADATAFLNPTADGQTETPAWQDTGGTNCSATMCSDEVSETGSSTACNGTNVASDGDTTYVRSATTSAIQTWDISESSIPDGSTVTQAVVEMCSRKEPTQGQTITMAFCNGASCTDGTASTQAQTYSNYSATISSLSIAKTGSSDFELRVTKDANTRAARVSRIGVTLTYTLPAGGGPRRMFITELRPKR